ncbi:MAG: carboxymuconolactone decarboxylase family protein [Micromonosporaceae bacterium]
MSMTQSTPRMDFQRLNPRFYKTMLALDSASAVGPDKALLELMRIRASQINGCAYCIDMHTKDARARGETEQRIYGLSAWRETPYYTERERAALALTEAVTLVAEGHVAGEVYEQAAKHFTEEEVAQLIALIVTINAWNRIAITTRITPGGYEPGE